MERFRTRLGIILNVFALPALLIHEISHVLGCFIFLKIPDSFGISFRLYSPIGGFVGYNDCKRLEWIVYPMISLTPLFWMVGVLILAIHFPMFWILFIYHILTIHYSLPSIGDLNIILRTFGSFRRFNDFLFYHRLHRWIFPEWYALQEELEEQMFLESLEPMIDDAA